MTALMFVCCALLFAFVVVRAWSSKPVADDEQRSRPWWYSALARIAPGRCREIPEADNPTWCEHKDPIQATAITPSGKPPENVGYCKVCGAAPRIVLRQFSIWKRHWYLQQFGCSEDPRFMHSHPCRFMLVLGLWGRYTERRIAGGPNERIAPYCYTMDAGHVHHVQRPAAGHTALFLMFGVRHDVEGEDKLYFGTPEYIGEDAPISRQHPFTAAKPWKQHIRRKVARI